MKNIINKKSSEKLIPDDLSYYYMIFIHHQKVCNLQNEDYIPQGHVT